VYDIIFHPDTLYLAGKDARMKELVHATAFDALESSFGVRVERAGARFPKLKFKGVFRPTVIRKPLAETVVEAEPVRREPEPVHPAPEQAEEVTVPSYTIRYRSNLDLQDFVIKGWKLWSSYSLIATASFCKISFNSLQHFLRDPCLNFVSGPCLSPSLMKNLFQIFLYEHVLSCTGTGTV
jgi:hypothetical protein